MTIQFVNHASFIISEGEISLICDPWLEGYAFNNGWKQISTTKMCYDDFSSITHIWFSHEHPDHFSPQNLLKIPREYRERITVLYQETTDKKVSNFCDKLGFKHQIELKADLTFELSSEFNLICNPYNDGDSYAFFNVNGTKVLNLNDCVVDTVEKALAIKEKIGDVDLLFTQFGYANKIGNVNDTELRKKASLEKLNRIKIQNQIFKPAYIIPFASYVFFCHEENKYMNDGIISIRDISSFISNELNKTSIILYPGDIWSLKENWVSEKSIQKYEVDYLRVKTFSFLTSEKIEIATLKEIANIFINKLKQGYPAHKLFINSLSSNIYITDYNQSVTISGKDGLKISNCPFEKCDILISSESLYYCFKELWGGDTLNVNARFQIQTNYNHFRKFGIIATYLNRNEQFPFKTPTKSQLRKEILKSILKKIIGAK